VRDRLLGRARRETALGAAVVLPHDGAEQLEHRSLDLDRARGGAVVHRPHGGQIVALARRLRQRGDARHLRRHQVEPRHALLLDGGEDVERVEATADHHGLAEEDRRWREAPRRDVVERRRYEVDVVGGGDAVANEVGAGLREGRAGVEAGVVHHRLGASRRPRRVRPHLRPLRGRAGDAVLRRPRRGGGLELVAEPQRRGPRRERCAVGFGDGGRGRSVGGDVGQFVGRRSGRDEHRGGASAAAREPRLQPLGAGAQRDEHGRARADSVGAEPPGQAVDATVELGEGDAAVVVGDGGASGLDLGPPAESGRGLVRHRSTVAP
jgi:hypothetical protein